jgi:hypothetical protein
MSYPVRLYGAAYLATALVIAAVILAFAHLWWFAAGFGLASVLGWIFVLRIGKGGSEEERQRLVDAGEQGIGGAGRALGGGWNPRRHDDA